MATILVHIALIAYSVGAAAFLTWLVRPDARLVRAGRLLLLVGVVVHFAAFGVSLGVAGAGLGVSEWKGGQLFSLLAAVTVAGYLVLDLKYELPVAGAFVAPFTVAVMVPAHLVHSTAREISPQNLAQPRPLPPRRRGGAGHGGAGAGLRARGALSRERAASEEQAARQAGRAAALAGPDRQGRVPAGGVGFRLPLARHRHRAPWSRSSPPAPPSPSLPSRGSPSSPGRSSPR